MTVLVECASTWSVALAGLDTGERTLVERTMQVMHYCRGSAILQEGRACPYLYVLREGRVKACFVDPAGREHIAGILGPGTVVGIVANLTDTVPVLTLECLDRVVAAGILRRDFLGCMNAIPKFATNVAKLVAAMYHRKIIASKAAGDSAPIRLGKVLCELATLPAPRTPHPDVAIEGLTHQDLAAMVGASRSWITQMLAAYERQGLLTCGRGAIQIQDVLSLTEYVRSLERASA